MKNIDMWIALYAALIATIIGIKDLMIYFKEYRSKIVIDINMLEGMMSYLYITEKKAINIPIKITNRSSKAKKIQLPHIIFPGHEEYSLVLNVLNQDREKIFPRNLEPGEEYVHTFFYWYLKEIKLRTSEKVKIVIIDTYGKKYSSKKFDYSINEKSK